MTRVGFLGPGRMGLPMAGNVRTAGFDVAVWNRTASKAVAFAEGRGARSALTVVETVADADVVISMLADDAAVQAAHAGPEGTFSAVRRGAVIVDMSTIAVATAKSLAKEASRRGLTCSP